jgi:type II secretory pathway component GspD/PulD (secretin)
VSSATQHTVRLLTRSELVPTLESLLAQNGAALVTNRPLYRVVPIAQAVATAASGAGMAGAVVVPLRYASAEDLAKVLQPYVGDGGKIAADPGRNALQVRIDAVIAEVTLNDALQYGTQFFFKSGGINGILSSAQVSPVNPGAAPWA